MKRLCVWLAAAAIAAFAAAAACRAAEVVTIFAAASLKNALDDVAKAHAARTGDRLRVSYAASSALAKQIESGAPADVFISADLDWMDYLAKRNLIDPASRVSLLRNRLALIAPAPSASTLKIGPRFPLAGALGNERLAIADPASVPAGRYARAALESLGVWKDVESRVAAATDVRSALVLVARGEAPFGIVYTTDAAVEPRVRAVDVFPEHTHPPIIYPAALVAASRNAAAAALLRSLGEPAARAIFDRHGFK